MKGRGMINSKNNEVSDQRSNITIPAPVTETALRQSVRKPAMWGAILILVFMGGAGAWGGLVRLPAGAVASGVVSPDGNRKTIQHLEGGIIAALQVRDGDVVIMGQPLITLESIQASTAFEALLGQYRTLLITQARLQAELYDSGEIAIPDEVVQHANDPGLREIINGQKSIFRTRKHSHATNQKVLAQRIDQSNEQIGALNAQLESASRQLDLIQEELAGKEELRSKGIISKPELLRLQRVQAEIRGRQGEYLGTIARVKQQIGETQTQLISLDAQRADQVSAQIDQVRLDLSVARERLSSSRDILRRTIVTAPVSGTIVNMRFKTEGGVVQKGESILEIVPVEDKLLIDARVSPNDIDVVHKGLSALIHLSTFSNRGLPRISGTVQSVSADRIQESANTQPYYLARVEVDRDALKLLQPSMEIIPGMPAEVLIVTAHRTMLEYMIEPFKQAFQRSFREV
jgi:HlyD family secretion protein/epimerase transport system membrane fusion protein